MGRCRYQDMSKLANEEIIGKVFLELDSDEKMSMFLMVS